MKILDIGEIVRRSGVAASTLRYYEEIGLITSIGRHGLRRQFAPDVMVRLSLIALGQSAGFSLAEIAGMFGPNGLPDLPRENLRIRADELETQIRRLKGLRDVLHHIADCPASTHFECPTFRRLMEAATRDKVAGGRNARTTPGKTPS